MLNHFQTFQEQVEGILSTQHFSVLSEGVDFEIYTDRNQDSLWYESHENGVSIGYDPHYSQYRKRHAFSMKT